MYKRDFYLATFVFKKDVVEKENRNLEIKFIILGPVSPQVTSTCDFPTQQLAVFLVP